MASKAELDNYKGDSALEKTNILMKLRETLIDDGEKTKVTIPPGLSVFPDNKRWAAFTVFALFAGLLGLTLLIPKDTSGSQKPAEGGQPTT